MQSSSTNSAPLLTVDDLAVSFDGATPPRVRAVDGACFTVHPSQTLAVVGESGCGKSVTAMSILRLLPSPPARYERGSIILRTGADPVDVLKLDESRLRRIRGAEVAMIFQEPMTSLNPVYTIGDQIIEAIRLHRHVTTHEALDIAAQSLADVGIAAPRERLRAYPHQFSGGMRQRVMIAMALACRPKLLLADEPTTALDVTIQAQILELLRELQSSRGMGIMLITHALGVVAENADVVCVMYAGRVVEYATVYDLFDKPLHPYTRGLLKSIPRPNQRLRRLETVRRIIDDPREFTHLPGADRGVRPWWPDHAPPTDLTPAPADAPMDSYCLSEIEPNHWVALWRTEAVARQPNRKPDLDYRREPIAAPATMTT